MRLIIIVFLGLVLPGLAFASWPNIQTPPAELGRTGTRDVALLVALEDYAFLPNVEGARTNLSDGTSF